MPVYTVYLSTQVTSPTSNLVVPLDKNNLSNCAWRIDFDNLFGGKNKEYSNCRVRYNLISNSFTASTPASTDWINYSGYLAISLPSSYNANTTNGTILGMIYPIDCPVTGTGIHCIQVSTLSECGVDINVPIGVQQVNIALINDDSMSFMTTFQEYQILLSFELYN
jgi:hypothetical protein